MEFIITAKIHGKIYVAMDCQGSFSNLPADGMIFYSKVAAEQYVADVETILERIFPETPAAVQVSATLDVFKEQLSNM